MAAKSTSFGNAWLQLLFNNVPITGIGDAGGLLASALAGDLYVGMHTATPGVGGDQTTNEIAYTGYLRVAVPRSALGWTVSGLTVVNTSAVAFPLVAGAGATALFGSIGSAAVGAGRLLYFGPIPGLGLVCGLGDVPTFNASSIVVTES